MIKTSILYDKWNPDGDHVTHVAIQTEANHPYVWRCYSRGEIIPQLPEDMAVIPIRAARNLFTFLEGKLDQVSRE